MKILYVYGLIDFFGDDAFSSTHEKKYTGLRISNQAINLLVAQPVAHSEIM